MGDREPPITATGSASFGIEQGGEVREANTHNRIRVDDDAARWAITPHLPGKAAPPSIDSPSPHVRRYMRRVLGAMQAAAPRPIRTPVPKPAPSKPKHRTHPDAATTCPLCKGDTWPDCEFCHGAGVVPFALAEEWRAAHED